MKRALIISSLLAACSTTNTSTDHKETAMNSTVNPLLKTWSGPYGGVPAFDTMRLEFLQSAFETAMSAHLDELDAIANNEEAATFDNTVVAMQRAGGLVDRAWAYYGLWRNNLATPEVREVAKVLAPKISEYNSKIIQNQKLFDRIRAVKDAGGLSGEDARLVELTYNDFAMNGATLRGEKRARYAAINKKLAELHTRFADNLLGDEEKYILYIDEAQTGGLPSSFKTAAASIATKNGKPGKFAISNTRSSMQPFLTFSTERALREKVWRTYYNRGDNGDERDNNALIAEILKLRHERIGLLGHENYAQWRLSDRMAKTPERAMDLMNQVWPAALSRVEQEVKDMQALADAELKGDAKITIEPWDYRFYAEKVRKARYDLDSDEVRQYLQLDKLIEAMHFVAGELFQFKFTELAEGTVPVFYEDVRVWEVTHSATKKHIGLWYLDPFARPGKRSGAWATTYRDQSDLLGETVLASNNSNFIKSPPGEPVLISWDDTRTLFHEFGHALHSLSGDVKYPRFNRGVRDYTEFQSQLLERWVLTDKVINTYLVHVETGKPIPQALVDKIKKAATFNQGFQTGEYLASALMDMAYHTVDPDKLDADTFERETLSKLKMPKEFVMRHRSPQFAHIFSGEGYSAGYYGYLWADVLTADAAEAFQEAPGGFYDQDLAKKLVEHLFAAQNAVDPAEAYRRFRGRDATIDALMRDRGLVSTEP